jgi:uracil-DNA glycosylase
LSSTSKTARRISPRGGSTGKGRQAKEESLEALLDELRACRACIDHPKGKPLPHEPRPVIRVSTTARLAVVGQAPGTRVHQSGIPFTDPSGDRLRQWMGVTSEEFYDETRVAIIPMGFCFPGLDAHGGDLPPRKECAPLWRDRLFALLPQIELVLLIGLYAQRWHLPKGAAGPVSDMVRQGPDLVGAAGEPRVFPLPHPSWRNNHWIKSNPWFEADVLPCLKIEVSRALGRSGDAPPGR